MALYIIERRFAEQLDLTDDDVRQLEAVNADEGVRWLFSFLSADHLALTACTKRRPRTDHGGRHRANIPADVIVEVEQQTLGAPGRPSAWAAGQAELQQ